MQSRRILCHRGPQALRWTISGSWSVGILGALQQGNSPQLLGPNAVLAASPEPESGIALCAPDAAEAMASTIGFRTSISLDPGHGPKPLVTPLLPECNAPRSVASLAAKGCYASEKIPRGEASAAAAATAILLASGAYSSLQCSEAERPSHGACEADLKDAIPLVKKLWEEVVRQELQQAGAHRMQQGCHIEEPRVRLLGDQLSVQVTLREGADPTSILYECAAALSGDAGQSGAGQVALRLSETGVARVLQLEAGGLWHAQIFLPRLGGKDASTAEILKRGGLDHKDVEALKGVFRAAMESISGPRPDHTMGSDFWQLPLGGDWGSKIHRPLPEHSRSGNAADGGEIVHSHGCNREAEGFAGPEAQQAAERLRSMGAQVFLPGIKAGAGDAVSWGELAGYEAQKAAIEDTLLLALQQPEVYERIAKRTRASFASNRPRAVLFEGPPGTGKTTSGRIIARQASVPMVYIPLESVMSKYYGESERLLTEVFQASEALGGCIIFLDEVDSLATTRGSDMHEATRRMLGVLLRQLDGFDNKRSVVIAATNRKQDLDPALLSRFDATILFDLPDTEAREKILRQFAQHLSRKDLEILAQSTQGMSGRDLRDICEQTERKWASKVIRKEVMEDRLPGATDYEAMVQRRREERG